VEGWVAQYEIGMGVSVAFSGGVWSGAGNSAIYTIKTVEIFWSVERGKEAEMAGKIRLIR
jgi:hypothetical protein